MDKSSIKPTYFQYPSLDAWLMLPITWLLFPYLAFACEAGLESLLGQSVAQTVMNIQPTLSTLFYLLLFVHFLEVLYALYKCQGYVLTGSTTLKWVVNVAFNGIYASRMLYDPYKYGKVSKGKKN